MSYDEELAVRIRRVLRRTADITERKMFGGLAFLCHGKMCCGIVGRDLMVRLLEKDMSSALRRAHVRPMDFTETAARLPLRRGRGRRDRRFATGVDPQGRRICETT